MEPVAGVDIGGTKIRWVRVRRGRVIAAREIRTPRDRAAFLAALRSIFLTLHRRGVRRVGVGFPGTVRGTKLVSARNIPFAKNINLLSIAPRGITLRTDNDARCFARAEAKLGAGRRTRLLFALTIGTGIGRAVAHDGAVTHIARFVRPEKWEGAYQSRVSAAPAALAQFLARKLAPLIAELSPDRVVIGGGAFQQPRFFKELKQDLREEGARAPVSRSRFRQNTGALGAALLVEK